MAYELHSTQVFRVGTHCTAVAGERRGRGGGGLQSMQSLVTIEF